MSRLRSTAAAVLLFLAAPAPPVHAQASMPTPPAFTRVPVRADDPDMRAITLAIRNIEQRLAAATAGGATTDASLAAHAARTTNVHGIPDSAVLETTSGAQAKATAAQGAATASAAAGLAAHVAASNPHEQYVQRGGDTMTGDLQVEQTDTSQIRIVVLGRPDENAVARVVLAGGDTAAVDLYGLETNLWNADPANRFFGVHDLVADSWPFWISGNGRAFVTSEQGLGFGTNRIYYDAAVEAFRLEKGFDSGVPADLYLGTLHGNFAPFQIVGPQVGLGHAPTEGQALTVGGRLLLLPPVVDSASAPRLSFGLYNGSDPAAWTEYMRAGLAASPGEGVAGTIRGDLYFAPQGGARVVMAPVFLDGWGGQLGINGSTALAGMPNAALHITNADGQPTSLVSLIPRSTPDTDLITLYRYGGGYGFRVRPSYAFEQLGGSLFVGNVEEVLSGSGTRVLGIADGTEPTTNPSGGFTEYSKHGRPHFRTAAGDVIDLATAAVPIPDADGTLADLTAKFNQLLAHLRAMGFIPSS